MIRMCFAFLFIFVLTNLQVEAEISCKDECLTKTYCISSDGSGVCSETSLVTALSEVIPVLITYDYLKITLTDYNITSDDEKTLKVSFEQSRSLKSVFTCYKSSTGSTDAKFDRDNYSLTFGSSSYKDGVLSCTWTFNIYHTIWFLYVDLIKDSYPSITLYDDSKEAIVAQNTSQLPIYHTQYLKCCNKVHGNDAFMLTFSQTKKHIRYQLYYWQYNANEVALTLTRKDGIQLRFECHEYPYVEGYIINGTVRMSIDQQIIDPYSLNAEICSWVTPSVLGDSRISIDASTTVFDLQVEAGFIEVYTEKDVTLKD